jgi:hypothetical protein
MSRQNKKLVSKIYKKKKNKHEHFFSVRKKNNLNLCVNVNIQ